MHSSKFAMVKKYYDTMYNGERMWGIEKVKNAVKKGMVTSEEFREITGEEYTPQ